MKENGRDGYKEKATATARSRYRLGGLCGLFVSQTILIPVGATWYHELPDRQQHRYEIRSKFCQLSDAIREKTANETDFVDCFQDRANIRDGYMTNMYIRKDMNRLLCANF